MTIGLAGRVAFVVSCALMPDAAASQAAAPRGSVTVEIRDSTAAPLPRSAVSAPGGVIYANLDGIARLSLTVGSARIVVSRLGFAPESLTINVRAGLDTTITVVLAEIAGAVEGMVVSATRSGRRVGDEPLRVEVLSEEEVEEKLLMTPGDISMMLNETSGLRVQVTSPSLGGASIRVQGLRGRYTQLLADGLPLYGGQAGGLGLLQIPPMDLGGVEVIKGVASALYGGSAVGGVVNLISRRPAATATRDFLVNRTTLGGTDLVTFLASGNEASGDAEAPATTYTLLAGLHDQRRIDRDADGWADIPGYGRVVVRPRLFWDRGTGTRAMFTAGFTGESRSGGTLPGRLAPDGAPFPERLGSRRFDVGAVSQALRGSGLFSARASASVQGHRHTIGATRERDTHATWFGEAAYTNAQGLATWVAGIALQQERYAASDVSGFDFTHTTPAIFVQAALDLSRTVSISASGRLDVHSEYGSFASPRLSVLLRPFGVARSDWTLRASAGSGYFAPTPLTEETEVTGLSVLRPLDDVRAELARSASIDLAGAAGVFEFNGTLFTSRLLRPVGLRSVLTNSLAVELVNAPRAATTAGVEVLLRASLDPIRATATYTFVNAHDTDPATGQRRLTPLAPRHQAGLVVAWESEGRGRAGFEVYHTGRQQLDDDAYRTESRPSVHVGVLGERRFGRVRVFVNAENLLDVRQTKTDRLVRPGRGRGGRWTNDVWAPLDGRIANVGVRFVAR